METSRSLDRSAWAGVSVGCALALLALIDQLALGWTKADVSSHYGRFGLHPDPNVLTGILMTSGVLFAGAMAVAVRKQGKGRRAAAAWWAGSAAVLWSGFALLASEAHEYDGYVLAPVWRFVPWAMPAAAIVMAVRTRR